MRSIILLVSVSILLGACSTGRLVTCQIPRLTPVEPPESDWGCPEPVDYPFENLVFQGGGVKGIAYGGALRVLDQQKILDNVKRVAGTSAGAITATLVALGYTSEEIEKLMDTVDFTKLEDDGSPFRVLDRYGYYKGDYFLQLMRCLVKRQTGADRLTFDELGELRQGNEHKHRYRELRLYTSDLNTGNIVELSERNTGGLEVALAARMSMSIPLFFAAVEPRKGEVPENLVGDVYVDGGLLHNYPIDAFDHDEVNKHTLGFALLDTSEQPRREIDDLAEYSKALVESLLDVQVEELLVDGPNLARTAVLDDCGVPTTDFRLSPKTRRELMKKGRECTCAFLKGWQDNFTSELFSLPTDPTATLRLSPGACGWLHPGPWK